MLLVTGVSGLLGASVMLAALRLNQRVAGLCHRHRFHVPGTQVFPVDLTDATAVRDLIVRLDPVSVIHCAAATNIDWCEDHAEEARRINAGATALLAELASERGFRLLYVSTDAVFDGARGGYSESDQPRPLNVYGESKLQGEQAVLQCLPEGLVVRVNLYGWNAQDKLSLAEWILGELEHGRAVPGFVDVHFTPILANDVAEILLTMLDRHCKGLYHAAGSERISKYEFARRVAVTFGLDQEQIRESRLAEARLRAPRGQDISLQTEKIQAELGKAMPDVDSGLRRFRALRDSGYAQQLKEFSSGATE